MAQKVAQQCSKDVAEQAPQASVSAAAAANHTDAIPHVDVAPWPESYHRHVSSEHKLFDLKLDELWRYRDLIFMLLKRFFAVSYKQTILGPLWFIFVPLLTSIMHLIVFGNIARLSTDGLPQLLFYFVGTAVWTLFSNCLNRNSTVFLSNAHLFGKVYFPRLAVPVSNILNDIVRFGIQMLLIIAFTTYFCCQGLVQINWAGLWVLPLIVIELALFGMGTGLIMSSCTAKYRDLTIVFGFVVQLWMYASPVVYPLSQLGDGFIRTMVIANPLTAPFELFRWGLFGQATVMWDMWGISILVTIVVLFIGIVLFNRSERTFLDTV